MGPPGVTSIHTPMSLNSEASIPATAAKRNVTPLRLGNPSLLTHNLPWLFQVSAELKRIAPRLS